MNKILSQDEVDALLKSVNVPAAEPDRPAAQD